MRLLDQCITFCLFVLSVLVGLPSAFLGVIGLSGGLTDTSDLENLQLGILFLSLAAVFLVGTSIWFVHLRRKLVSAAEAAVECGGPFDCERLIENDPHD